MASEVLDLSPGDFFVIEGSTMLFECSEVVRGEKVLKREMSGGANGIYGAVAPDEYLELEPWVRAWELEGPKGALRRRQFRAIRLTRVSRKVDDVRLAK